VYLYAIMMYDTISVIELALSCKLKVNSGNIHSYLGMTWDYEIFYYYFFFYFFLIKSSLSYKRKYTII
jgi:hypothetical protein